MRRFLLLLPLLLVLAACATPEESVDTPTPSGTELVDIPTTFTPLRPAIVDVPGDGTWVCTPSGSGQMSRCWRRGENIAAAPTPTDTTAVDTRAQSIIDQVRNTPPID